VGAEVASDVELETPVRAIPTLGVLCLGDMVELGWPEESELDRLTALRNRPRIRAGFLDPRPLDPLANREWLRDARRRPADALLAIRLRANGALCGMLGWTGWSTRSRTLEVGRIVVDPDVARPFRSLRPRGYRGIAVDASIALRDYLFGTIGAHVLHSTYLVDNRLAARLNRLVGGRVLGTASVRRADGTLAKVAKLELTRSEWLQSHRPIPT
jgi:RimJ/RimL family protein N-acetyltransferase